MKLENHFPSISFDREAHRYFVDGEEYTSISAILDRCIPAFDKERVSKWVASREGISQEEVKSKWDIRRDLSMVRGTEFHLYVQTYLEEKRKIPIQTPIEHEIQEFHRFWDGKNFFKYEILATEIRVCDREWKIAGTVDCVLRHRETGQIYLIDWKTNQEIKRKNNRRYLLEPVSHLEDSNINKYMLQTSFYQFILEKNTDLEITSSFLIHFPRGKSYAAIECPRAREEVINILQFQRKSETSLI